jgi:hypothetical protein
MDVMTNGQLIYYSGIGSMALGAVFSIVMIVLSGFKRKKADRENEIQEKNDENMRGEFARNATVIVSDSMNKTEEIEPSNNKTVFLESSEDDKTALLNEDEEKQVIDDKIGNTVLLNPDDSTQLLIEEDKTELLEE